MKDRQLGLARADQEQWLKLYYFLRAAVSLAWVVAAFAVGQSSAVIGGLLLVAYPAWDAAGDLLDALRSGGLRQNRTQALNVLVSLATMVAVVVALQMSMNRVLGVFGAWAILSGLLQLGTAVRRWKSYGAQVGHGAQRRSVSPGRRLLHFSSHDACGAVDRERYRLCRSRRALLPGLGDLAHRQSVAACGGGVMRWFWRDHDIVPVFCPTPGT